MKIKEYLFLISFILIGVLVIYTYKELPNTFFQQDEWWAFGKFISRELTGGLSSVILNPLIEAGKIHFNPLTNIGFYTEFKLFKLNFQNYAYVSIGIHLLNVFLVYYLCRLLIKNNWVNFSITLLFAINSASHQAVSWVAAAINTQGMTFFSLLFLVSFIKYLQGNARNDKLLFLSYLFAIIAPLFKETLVPFLFMPIIYWLYSEEKNLKSIKKIFIPFVIFLTIYFIIRFIVYLLGAPIIGGGNAILVQAGIGEYFYRLTLLPFRILTQSLLPTGIMLSLSESLINLGYPQFSFHGIPNPFIRETIAYDLLSFFLGGFLFVLSFFAFKYFKKKQNNSSKVLIFFFLIYVLNSVLLIFIPGSPGYASLIEQRYLYPGMFGAIGIFIIVVFWISSWLRKLAIIPIIFILVITSVTYMWTTKKEIARLEDASVVRKYILNTITRDYPKLSNKTVFYIQSDTAYNGLEEKSIPQQIGVGLILLVNYQDKEYFPSCLYDSNLFFQILSQGYKECDGRGFGYFTNYDKLIEALKKNKLLSKDVIAFSWKGKIEEINNITDHIRNKIGTQF